MKVVLIGLGKIARYHIAALLSTPRYVICGVCDTDPHAVSADLLPGVPMYRAYEQMLDELHPDIAVIATPPATHYAIALACVQRGVTPYVEKPLAATEEEVKHFFEAPLAGRFVPMYHTLYGEELIWIEAHCPLHDIRSIRMELDDPYADANGHIDPAFYNLGGCWLDSAPNALAPLFRILQGQSLENVHVHHQLDSLAGLPYTSLLTAKAGKTDITICVRWDRGLNRKRTIIEADGHQYVLNHSQQAVECDGEQVFVFDAEERLVRQYANLYRLYPARIPSEQTVKHMSEIMYKNI